MTGFFKLASMSAIGIGLSELLGSISVFLKVIILVLTAMYGFLKYLNELNKYNKNKQENDKSN